MVEDHLSDHPDQEWGPVAIGKTLHRSSGAVASALEILVTGGVAQRTSDRPKRYRIAERQPCEVPRMSIAGPANLGLYQQDDTAPIPGDFITGDISAGAEVPIEFFGDPGRLAGSPLR